MTKAKPGLTEAKAASRLLRETLMERMRQHGPQTVQQLAEVIGRDAAEVRAMMSNLVKNGHARSRRESGPSGVVARYSPSDPSEHVRNVSAPNRPVLKQWPACQVRDPFHLPQNFFSRTA